MKRLLDRIAIQREVTAKVKRKASQGKDAKTIRKEVRDEMEAKYGMDVNWAEILKIVLQVLTLLLAVL
jgi:hypothetical protein